MDAFQPTNRHPHASPFVYNLPSLQLYSRRQPFHPVNLGWSEVLYLTEDTDGLERYASRKVVNGRIRTTYNVWCRREVENVLQQHKNPTRAQIISAMRKIKPFEGKIDAIAGHLRNHCPERAHLPLAEKIADVAELKLYGGMHVDVENTIKVVESTLRLGTTEEKISYLSMWSMDTKPERRVEDVIGITELVVDLNGKPPAHIKTKEQRLNHFVNRLEDPVDRLFLIPDVDVTVDQAEDFFHLLRTLPSESHIHAVLCTIRNQTSTHLQSADTRLTFRFMRTNLPAFGTEYYQDYSVPGRVGKKGTKQPDLKLEQVKINMAKFLWKTRRTTLDSPKNVLSAQRLEAQFKSTSNRTLQAGNVRKTTYKGCAPLPLFTEWFRIYDAAAELERGRNEDGGGSAGSVVAAGKVEDAEESIGSAGPARRSIETVKGIERKVHQASTKRKRQQEVEDKLETFADKVCEAAGKNNMALHRIATKVGRYAIVNSLSLSVQDVATHLKQVRDYGELELLPNRLRHLSAEDIVKKVQKAVGKIPADVPAAYLAVFCAPTSIETRERVERLGKASAYIAMQDNLATLAASSPRDDVPLAVYPGTTSKSVIARSHSTTQTAPNVGFIGPVLDAFGLLGKATTVVKTSSYTASLLGNESSLLRVPLFRQDVSNPLDRFTSEYSAGEVIAHAIFNKRCSLPSLAVVRAGNPVQHDAGDDARRLAEEYGAAAGIEGLVCIFSAPPPVIQSVDEDDGQVTGNQIFSLLQQYQTLFDDSQLPDQHVPLPAVKYIDVDGTGDFIEDRHAQYPPSCLQDFEKRLQAVLAGNSKAGHVFACLSQKVFYSLDIVNGLRTSDKNSKYLEMLGTSFVASLPGVAALTNVLWVLAQEPAHLKKIGSPATGFASLNLTLLFATVSASMYRSSLSPEENLEKIRKTLAPTDLLEKIVEAHTSFRPISSNVHKRARLGDVPKETFVINTLPCEVYLKPGSTSFSVANADGKITVSVRLNVPSKWQGMLKVELVQGMGVVFARIIDASKAKPLDGDAESMAYLRKLTPCAELSRPPLVTAETGQYVLWKPSLTANVCALLPLMR